MEKLKVPCTTRLKPPSGSSSIPKPSQVLQPLEPNRMQVGPLKHPARRIMSRRSKSFSDLRTATRPVARKYDVMPLASITKATSTANLDIKKPVLFKPTLKTISAVSKSSAAPRTTVKRPAPPVAPNLPDKPKISKPMKIPPYDYKARFHALTEKHTNVLQGLKDANQKALEGEKACENYNNLQAEYVKLQDKQNKLERDNLEHVQVINTLKENEQMLNSNIETLSEKYFTLQSNHAALQEKYNEIKVNYDRLTNANRDIKEELTLACNTIKQLELAVQQSKMLLQTGEEVRRTMQNTIADLKGTIRVFCRVRPPIEQEQDRLMSNILCTDEITLEIRKSHKDMKMDFTFDKVFAPEASQAEVFEELSQLVQSALDGYHICVFAYGQTGSGKTFTMQGADSEERSGMIPRTVGLIFSLISKLQQIGWEYTVDASFLEIYNEVVRDLLNPYSKQQHEIRFNEGKGMTVTNLTIQEVNSAEKLHQLMATANNNRATAATNYNEHSSRSHAVTKIGIRGVNKEMGICSVGSLNLVDLAGSESAKTSSAERMTETKNINKSLSTLGTVMLALYNKENHIPYRNSKLTYLLQTCLGGNSKTLMFVNIAPFEECYGESINALRFAAQIKEVKTGSRKNKTYL